MTTDDPRPTPGDDATDPWTPDPGGAGSPGPRGPRRRGLLITALVLFGVGAVFTVLAALVPLILDRDAPTVLYLVAMICTPLGFLLGLLYALLSARPPRV